MKLRLQQGSCSIGIALVLLLWLVAVNASTHHRRGGATHKLSSPAGHNNRTSFSYYARIKGGFTSAFGGVGASGFSSRRGRGKLKPSTSRFSTRNASVTTSSRNKRYTPSMTVSSMQLSSPPRFIRSSNASPKSNSDKKDDGISIGDLITPAMEKATFKKKEAQTQKTLSLPSRLDMAIVLTYFCNAIVFTLPVVLLPLLAAEQAALGGSSMGVAAFCASVASLAAMGGAIGKFCNGFVCQQAGGRRSSVLYMLGMAACISFLASTNLGPNSIGWTMAGMEFFVSIQWTACTVLLANHYDGHPERFASGITALSMASTSGTLMTKIVGTVMLQHFHWRRVAQMGTVVAVVGALCMRVLAQEYPVSTSRRRNKAPTNKEPLDFSAIASSLKSVLGKPLFWQVGIAHAMAFLGRTSDRVLGTFFHETTNLPSFACGGLTMSCTLGFIHGLMKGGAFHKLKTVAEKETLLKKRYATAVLSALALALCANTVVASLFVNKILLAVAVALFSGSMASSLAFQFYHIPPTVAKAFGENKAVCLSFLDGLGFFLAAPIWAITSQIVSHPSLGPHGWSVAWTMLAILFGWGGKVMMDAIPPVLESEHKAESSSN